MRVCAYAINLLTYFTGWTWLWVRCLLDVLAVSVDAERMPRSCCIQACAAVGVLARTVSLARPLAEAAAGEKPVGHLLALMARERPGNGQGCVRGAAGAVFFTGAIGVLRGVAHWPDLIHTALGKADGGYSHVVLLLTGHLQAFRENEVSLRVRL